MCSKTSGMTAYIGKCRKEKANPSPFGGTMNGLIKGQAKPRSHLSSYMKR